MQLTINIPLARAMMPASVTDRQPAISRHVSSGQCRPSARSAACMVYVCVHMHLYIPTRMHELLVCKTRDLARESPSQSA